ncbi:MAG: DJ-1 family glyoxalase III [Spirochaetales bacterium]
MKQVLVVLAPGFEELEAVAPIDLGRRAGLIVTIAGLDSLTVTSKRGLTVTCDELLDPQKRHWDALVLPGGLPGADHLAASPKIAELLAWFETEGRWIAAICAAPARVLGSQGLLKGRRWTGFPGTDDQAFGGFYQSSPVVVDGHVLTSRGVGTATEFSLKLISLLLGEVVATRVARETLLAD